MGRKRKAGGLPFGRAEEKAGYEDRQEKHMVVNRYEDVADSEDEFHINRDKILLDENVVSKWRRKAQESDARLESSDEEILSIEDDDGEDDDDFGDLGDEEEDEEEVDYILPSGGNITAIDVDSIDSDGQDKRSAEDEMAWGTSKRDYYDADAITTEQDALDEEAEALRMQKKQLEGMTEADFGLDDLEAVSEVNDHGINRADTGSRIVTEKLPALEITDAMSSEERMNILRIRYPEFEPLAAEYLHLKAQHEDLQVKAENLVPVLYKTDCMRMPLVVTKYRALGAYLSTIAMYFAIMTDGAREEGNKWVPMTPEDLRAHPVMEMLLECRDVWQKLHDMTEAEEEDVWIDELRKDDIANGTNLKTPNGSQQAIGVLPENGQIIAEPAKPRRGRRKSKAQRAAEAAQAAEEEARLSRIRETEASLADINTLTLSRNDSENARAAAYRPSEPSAIIDDNDSDIGEQLHLTPAEAAARAAKKKSLRFYTSQIAQKSAGRDRAGRDAGGDADIPYKERLKEKQARLKAETEARRRKMDADGRGGIALDDPNAPEDESARIIRGQEQAVDSDEEYYDMVTARSNARKSERQTRDQIYQQAKEEGGIVRVIEYDPNGEGHADGKRAITRVIEKNKGLAPRRKKEVRNPRVKKRNRYESKMKKLGSMKPVYRGGESKGGYAGELTGIQRNLVKGVKL